MARPVPVGEMADALALHPDYRVLRRLEPIRRSARGGLPGGLVPAVALDVETTGLDHRSDRIIELALRQFWIDPAGRIALVGEARSWLEDPGRPLPEEIARLTGLSDAMLAGRSIFDPVAICVLRTSRFVVSHNAAFDRPFVEARLPAAAGAAWVCSLADVDWRSLGFEGRALNHLLLQMGWFYGAHRARGDVDALLRLLDHPVFPGRTVLGVAAAKAALASWVVEARGAPFEARVALKGRGYRWNAVGRFWQREVADAALEAEVAWCVAEVYRDGRVPVRRRVTWTERYAAPAPRDGVSDARG